MSPVIDPSSLAGIERKMYHAIDAVRRTLSKWELQVPGDYGSVPLVVLAPRRLVRAADELQEHKLVWRDFRMIRFRYSATHPSCAPLWCVLAYAHEPVVLRCFALTCRGGLFVSQDRYLITSQPTCEDLMEIELRRKVSIPSSVGRRLIKYIRRRVKIQREMLPAFEQYEQNGVPSVVGGKATHFLFREYAPWCAVQQPLKCEEITLRQKKPGSNAGESKSPKNDE